MSSLLAPSDRASGHRSTCWRPFSVGRHSSTSLYAHEDKHQLFTYLVTRPPSYPFLRLHTVYAYRCEQFGSVAIIHALRRSSEIKRVAIFGDTQLGSQMLVRSWTAAADGAICGARLQELFVPLDSSLAVHLAAFLLARDGNREVHTLHLSGASSVVPSAFYLTEVQLDRLVVRHLDGHVLVKLQQRFTPRELTISDYALDIDTARKLTLKLTSHTTHLQLTVCTSATWYELGDYLESDRCGLEYLRLHFTEAPEEEKELASVEATCRKKRIKFETNTVAFILERKERIAADEELAKRLQTEEDEAVAETWQIEEDENFEADLEEAIARSKEGGDLQRAMANLRVGQKERDYKEQDRA